MADGWLQVVQDALKVPGLLVEIYGDLARPGVRQVGKALETIVGLGNTVLWPIALANEKSRISLEKNFERYRKQMELVPEEKVVNVAPEIGVPVAEKMAYVSDESLADLYIKLLATASNADTLENAHPSFVNVVNNISPDEARLLGYFAVNATMPFVKVRAKSNQAQGGGFIEISGPVVADEILQELIFKDNLDAYLSNLAGLGLVSYKHDEWLINDALYAPLEAKVNVLYKHFFATQPVLAGKEMKFARGVVRVSSFGKKFIAGCHKE